MMALGFTSVAWLVFLIIPFSALSELLTPTLGSFFSNQVSDFEQGKLQGVLASLSAFTTIISPLIMTTIFNRTSNVNDDFYLPGAPYLFSSFLLLVTIIPLSIIMKSISQK
jgi:DHA1 family tetracycline resistance protein-like MFS transporter